MLQKIIQFDQILNIFKQLDSHTKAFGKQENVVCQCLEASFSIIEYEVIFHLLRVADYVGRQSAILCELMAGVILTANVSASR